MTHHQPRFANIFYYADAGRLRAIVEACIEDAPTTRLSGTLRGLIVPHGTHLECGPIAGYAYKLLYVTAQHWERLTVLAPALQPSDPSALLIEPAEGYATPLDIAQIDHAALQTLRHAGLALHESDDDEPIIETQLPFLQLALGNLPILPVRVPAGYTPPPALSTHVAHLGLIIAAANVPAPDHVFAQAALAKLDSAALRSEHAIKLPGLLGRSKTLAHTSDLATIALAVDLARAAGAAQAKLLFAAGDFTAWGVFD